MDGDSNKNAWRVVLGEESGVCDKRAIEECTKHTVPASSLLEIVDICDKYIKAFQVKRTNWSRLSGAIFCDSVRVGSVDWDGNVFTYPAGDLISGKMLNFDTLLNRFAEGGDVENSFPWEMVAQERQAAIRTNCNNLAKTSIIRDLADVTYMFPHIDRNGNMSTIAFFDDDSDSSHCTHSLQGVRVFDTDPKPYKVRASTFLEGVEEIVIKYW